MGADPITFTLERLHDTTSRLEIFGRWDGVRGRRFIRPTLSFPDGTRVLAELADKPWMPGEAGAWRVAFRLSASPRSWASGEPAELSVAPDLAVEFGAGAQPGTVLPGRAPRGTPVDTLAAVLAAPEPEVAATATVEPETSNEVDRLRSALAEAQEARELALAQARSAAAARDEALARREEAVRERDAALAERDQARAASEEAHALLARALTARRPE